MAKKKMDYQKGFILYKDSQPLIKKLSLEDAGRLINAIFDYEVDGTAPDDLPPAADMAFAAIQNYLDRDAAAYKEKCEINAENGRKGGLSTQEKARQDKANQANASNAKANQANQADIDIDTNIENNIESESDFKGEMYKGDEQTPAPPPTITRFSWPTFEKEAKEAYKDAITRYSCADCLKIFRYFFETYTMKTSTAHPPLKKDAVIAIINKIAFIEDAHGHIIDIEPDDYPAMIDQYFNTPFENCDYHITHFFSGDIRTNRFYESVY